LPVRKFGERQPKVHERVFVAPNAEVIGDVILNDDVSIWFGAVLRGDIESITVGARSNVQDNAVVHCDEGFPCVIGNDVIVGHGAIIHGATIHNGALIGMGAILLNGAVIGEGAIIAAGALVPEGKEIPAGYLAVGVPAKALREISAEERERLKKGTTVYVDEKDRYLHELES
jgi:carbonic anhydrase/acetyltransferase-like protein (isoleucine patch superfamily)